MHYFFDLFLCFSSCINHGDHSSGFDRGCMIIWDILTSSPRTRILYRSSSQILVWNCFMWFVEWIYSIYLAPSLWSRQGKNTRYQTTNKHLGKKHKSSWRKHPIYHHNPWHWIGLENRMLNDDVTLVQLTYLAHLRACQLIMTVCDSLVIPETYFLMREVNRCTPIRHR